MNLVFADTFYWIALTISEDASYGNPHDNVACESFMKMLRNEEVYRNEYRDFPEAVASIG